MPDDGAIFKRVVQPDGRIFLDFNRDGDAAPPGGINGHEYLDQDEISDKLSACAQIWVPEIVFPRGRFGDTKHEWRCGDASGRPPTNRGSFRIELDRPRAGWFTDFDKGSDCSGGPLATLREATGKTGRELFEYAAELIERCGYGSYSKPKGNGDHEAERNAKEARHTWDNAHVLTGDTITERYLRARGITLMPNSGDVRDHPSCTNWETRRGESAMVALMRDPRTLAPTGGVHRTYINPDTLEHGPKKMIGAAGVILLRPITNRELAIGEGAETSLAGAQQHSLSGGVMAAGSKGSMGKLAEAIEADSSGLRSAVDRVYIFPDQNAEAVARRLAMAAAATGAEVWWCPPVEDDKAADLAAGRAPPKPVRIEAGAPAPGEAMPPGGADIDVRIASLSESSPTAEITAIIRDVLSLKLLPAEQQKLLDKIRTRVIWSKKIMDETVKALKRLPDERQRRISYHSQFQCYESGEAKPIMGNVVLVLRNDDAVRGSIWFNEFTGMISVRKQFPWESDPGAPCERPWTDADELALTEWLQLVVGLHCPSHIVFQGVARIADDNKFHPVLDYLDSLSWDKTRRIENWVVAYLSVVDTPLNRAIGCCFLIGLVARVYRPGCKMEDMLTLEGEQGIGKSTALRIIAGDEWFTDEISDFGSKDAALQMRGKWIIEIAELDVLGRADNSRIKTFLSRTTDRFRPPYGRHLIETQRQCVIAGTTNEFEYSKDPTGGRRYWSMRCGKILLQALKRDRDQLLAEAVAAYRSGAHWWLEKPDLIEAQKIEANERYQADPWENVVCGWLRHNAKRTTTTDELLKDALDIQDKARWDRAATTRLGHILRRLGWRVVKQKGGRADRRLRVYGPPDDWWS
jgi:putative DNA primase/helicase